MSCSDEKDCLSKGRELELAELREVAGGVDMNGPFKATCSCGWEYGPGSFDSVCTQYIIHRELGNGHNVSLNPA